MLCQQRRSLGSDATLAQVPCDFVIWCQQRRSLGSDATRAHDGSSWLIWVVPTASVSRKRCDYARMVSAGIMTRCQQRRSLGSDATARRATRECAPSRANSVGLSEAMRPLDGPTPSWVKSANSVGLSEAMRREPRAERDELLPHVPTASVSRKRCDSANFAKAATAGSCQQRRSLGSDATARLRRAPCLPAVPTASVSRKRCDRIECVGLNQIEECQQRRSLGSDATTR